MYLTPPSSVQDPPSTVLGLSLLPFLATHLPMPDINALFFNGAYLDNAFPGMQWKAFLVCLTSFSLAYIDDLL
jgi:hypothetical protein